MAGWLRRDPTLHKRWVCLVIKWDVQCKMVAMEMLTWAGGRPSVNAWVCECVHAGSCCYVVACCSCCLYFTIKVLVMGSGISARFQQPLDAMITSFRFFYVIIASLWRHVSCCVKRSIVLGVVLSIKHLLECTFTACRVTYICVSELGHHWFR